MIRLGSDTRVEFEGFNISQMDISLFNIDIQNAINQKKLGNCLQQCYRVIYKGTEYLKGQVLAIDQDGYHCNVTLGKICLFILHDNSVYILFEVVENNFLPYLNAYEIGHTIKYVCNELQSFLDYKPLNIYVLGNMLCIKPQHAFVSRNL